MLSNRLYLIDTLLVAPPAVPCQPSSRFLIQQYLTTVLPVSTMEMAGTPPLPVERANAIDSPFATVPIAAGEIVTVLLVTPVTYVQFPSCTPKDIGWAPPGGWVLLATSIPKTMPVVEAKCSVLLLVAVEPFVVNRDVAPAPSTSQFMTVRP